MGKRDTMYSILDDISKWPVERRVRRLKELYKERIGEELDIDNPKRFTEKIQWMKIYYSTPEIIRCIDKVTFKDYISKHLGTGYTAKMYKVWHTPEEVCLDGLPQKCVIKSNCSSEGRNMRIISSEEGADHIDKESLTEEIRGKWFDRRTLCTNSFITAYHQVTPSVFVEELIPGFDGANEYKLFCFHGEPKCLYVPRYKFINGVESSDFSVSFYTADWKFMNFSFGKYEAIPDLERPKKLDQMVELARKLSKDFPFVRVDFIDTRERIYLSEMTFFPSGGLIPFHPIGADEMLGNWLRLDILRSWSQLNKQ